MDISRLEGPEAEQKFIKDAEANGWKYKRHATKFEDMWLHWDVMFDTPNGCKTIDVKAHKHEYRDGPFLKNWFWVEWKNVRGNDGWLYGQSDYIAFQYFNKWYIYKTNNLKGVCELLVDFERTASRPSEADYAVYTRRDRKDQTSLIMISDLKRIEEFVWTT
jgi:hypothetical protein